MCLPTGRTGREWWCIRHLRRASGCGLWRWGAGVLLYWRCDGGSLPMPLASAQKISDPLSRSSQNVLSSPPIEAGHQAAASRLPLRSAGRTAFDLAYGKVEAFFASLDLASLQSVDINSIHICMLCFVRFVRQPITPILRTTPHRRMQICRQRRNDIDRCTADPTTKPIPCKGPDGQDGYRKSYRRPAQRRCGASHV